MVLLLLTIYLLIWHRSWWQAQVLIHYMVGVSYPLRIAYAVLIEFLLEAILGVGIYLTWIY
jgi:hypothetical protein